MADNDDENRYRNFSTAYTCTYIVTNLTRKQLYKASLIFRVRYLHIFDGSAFNRLRIPSCTEHTFSIFNNEQFKTDFGNHFFRILRHNRVRQTENYRSSAAGIIPREKTNYNYYFMALI